MPDKKQYGKKWSLEESDNLPKFTKGGKTTAELYEEKTGKSWSSAKAAGLTDGSFDANMRLLNRMESKNFDVKKEFGVSPRTVNTVAKPRVTNVPQQSARAAVKPAPAMTNTGNNFNSVFGQYKTPQAPVKVGQPKVYAPVNNNPGAVATDKSLKKSELSSEKTKNSVKPYTPNEVIQPDWRVPYTGMARDASYVQPNSYSTNVKPFVLGETTHSRSDLKLDNDTKESNQRFVNSLVRFGYKPEGFDDKNTFQQNVDAMGKRATVFNQEKQAVGADQPYQPTPSSKTNFDKESHRNRYDATQNYFGLPQRTFVPSTAKMDSGSDYPTYKYADPVKEQKYKDLALKHGLFAKFKEAEADGQSYYVENTHDTENGVANAHSIGVKRDKKTGQPYVFYYDLWDLAANPADFAADFVPVGKKAIHDLVSENVKPLTGVRGRPYNIYNRLPITTSDSIRHIKTKYTELKKDQNTRGADAGI